MTRVGVVVLAIVIGGVWLFADHRWLERQWDRLLELPPSAWIAIACVVAVVLAMSVFRSGKN